MANKTSARLIITAAFAAVSLMAAAVYPQILGLAIFGFFVLLGALSAADKKQTLQLRQQTQPEESSFSRNYSLNKTESHDDVIDKPLSEAERNVVNGK